MFRDRLTMRRKVEGIQPDLSGVSRVFEIRVIEALKNRDVGRVLQYVLRFSRVLCLKNTSLPTQMNAKKRNFYYFCRTTLGRWSTSPRHDGFLFGSAASRNELKRDAHGTRHLQLCPGEVPPDNRIPSLLSKQVLDVPNSA